MAVSHFTVGMAGHIDHGKTSLTKALTNIDTDRLKEEKERNISIEPGYAPLMLTEDMTVSIVDVPGHERFIRQMIAGVAGIDVVVLVIAADEGVMPQTREHLDILSLLHIQKGLIALTKITKVDEEFLALVKEDVQEQVKGTFLENAPVVGVDSLTKEGLDDLKREMIALLSEVEQRDTSGPFRLPIDQVFTVHGQGTVVRGTVYEGEVKEGDSLLLLPQQVKVKARQIQTHHQAVHVGQAGERIAINIGGLTKEKISRGDVLVSSESYYTSKTIDVSLQIPSKLQYEVKQRSPVRVHLGTAEVDGKIVFFDRNELGGAKDIVCQLRLDEPVVVKRGDRFIIRRPSPVETIGGGAVIEPVGEKYRFGKETTEMLERKRKGTPKERAIDVLTSTIAISDKELFTLIGLEQSEGEQLIEEAIEEGKFVRIGKFLTLTKTVTTILEELAEELHDYHKQFPMREGKQKAELVQMFSKHLPKEFIEQVLQRGEQMLIVKKKGPYYALEDFDPHLPKSWEKRVESVVANIKKQGVQVDPFLDELRNAQIPEELYEDILHFYTRSSVLVKLDSSYYIHQHTLDTVITSLSTAYPEFFTIQNAKEVLQVSRKYLVPILEMLDNHQWTDRNEGVRTWKKSLNR
ncbi:selenocysteine-specific translation elongation factor [Alkalihalobacterium bogoriense]|uniref:selenocysteine-specific translation elongation factor n=1 Tax=Alkalihalobacterium bogoriense TaxID=246272 RepID=UPI0004794976|nr:selenocysteine-specific translation elongation factor [Alkalihalobacterium bogoriense]